MKENRDEAQKLSEDSKKQLDSNTDLLKKELDELNNDLKSAK